MADNIAVKNDDTTDVGTLAADDIGGVLFARTKLVHGADGVNDGDVSTANPLPVDAREVGGNAITTGAGAVASGTQRMTLASDDPAVAKLGTIDADTSALAGCVAGTEVQVDVVSSALPSGAATETTLAAVAGYLDTEIQAIVTAIQILDNVISGSEAQVDIVGALPAGTNSIGEVTANAGTNLNTSALALESGGNLEGAATSLAAIDDWDESDRAKVNVIAGQAGISAGAGAVAANTPRVTLSSDDPAVAKLTDIETNTDSLAVVGNGAAATAQRVTLANDSTGVLATVSTVTTLTGGGVAHDSADSGNPHKIGAKATTAQSALTLVADADRTDLRAGIDGIQLTRPHTNLEDIVSGNASNTDGSSTQCIAAQASGIKTYLTTIILTNTSSSNIYVEIKDGTTVKLTIPVPANGGAVVNLPVPLGGTAATAWNFDASAATTTLYCSMIGFKSKV